MGRVTVLRIESPGRLVRELLAWYDGHARDLPWRRTKDPYAIWISEIMLQQTRVEVVGPRWERFLISFPTVGDLAQATEDEVLAEWAGLGYYRRARALHQAAQQIVSDHDGCFPRSLAQVLDLPGIGAYTAGAITSIAFGQSEALVDGNVERVFARMFHLDEARASANLKRLSWDIARELVPTERPGDWNQALMELGATLCSPTSPACPDCPLQVDCASGNAAVALAYPRPKAKSQVIQLEVECLLIVKDGKVLLIRRGPNERMAGLYELPTREVCWDSKEAPGIFSSTWTAGLEAESEASLAQLSHGITKHRIRARIRPGRADSLHGQGVWAAPGDWARLGLTGMTAKALGKSGCEVATLGTDR